MRIIKRLYLFILKSFLPLFAMTFFIVLFIVLMQFLWKYIDDMVGKGLSIEVLGELFFYAAVSMVPMALPLAILLASLMTFGNFGEKFELTAMKASGISLLKVMSPLIVFISFIAVGAFFFQNDVLPKAQVKMWTLLFSMKQKSPELEIPEGTFYDQIPGYNLFVKHKNKETGMLYDVMIYDISHGGDNATILLSDSARLAFTPDMRYLYLHLFTGEQFENLREQTNLDRNVPFRRENFLDKEVLIAFDANFNRMDEEGMRKQYVGKNISELRATIDSIGHRVDSIGAGYAEEIRRISFAAVTREDKSNRASSVSQDIKAKEATKSNKTKDETLQASPVNMDSLLNTLDRQKLEGVFTTASNLTQRRSGEMQYRAEDMANEKKTIRRHEIELLKKYTLSVACLLFFFIGAPLGAIIRKGGLGTPLVISILLFLVYYIFDNTGYKMARDGHWPIWFGMWLSSFVLIPLGCYVTIKAMNDSAVFDKDFYINILNRILGRRQARSVRAKEVIINDISVPEAIERLFILKEKASEFLTRYRKRQTYLNFWLYGYDMEKIREISSMTDDDVDYLTDCRDPFVVNKLTEIPVIVPLRVYRPSRRKWLSWTMIVLFPIGITIWLFGLDAQSKLRADMKQIMKACDTELTLLKKIQENENNKEDDKALNPDMNN